MRCVVIGVLLAVVALLAGTATAHEAPPSASIEGNSRAGTDSYPSLEHRDLGEAWSEGGEPVVWGRVLPLFAQDVIDQGFELPNPYGVAVVGYWQEQDLVLDSLAVGFGGAPASPIDFVDFGTPSVENGALQLKLDAWLFPFMNVFTTVGYLSGDARVPIAVAGDDLLDFIGFPGLCTGGPLEPALCQRTVSGRARPEYEGYNVTLGTTLAVGWEQFFAVLPITYAWAFIDILDDPVDALNLSPRIGITGDVAELGAIAVYVGATYLRADVNISGSIEFDTSGSGLPGVPDVTRVDYSIRQRNKDRWNYLVGFNWDVRRWFSLHCEAGFGGSRQNWIGSATFRF